MRSVPRLRITKTFLLGEWSTDGIPYRNMSSTLGVSTFLKNAIEKLRRTYMGLFVDQNDPLGPKAHRFLFYRSRCGRTW